MKLHFVKQILKGERIILAKVDGKQNVADFGTKALCLKEFQTYSDIVYNDEVCISYLRGCMSNDLAILQLTNTLENTVEYTARVRDELDRYDEQFEEDNNDTTCLMSTWMIKNEGN